MLAHEAYHLICQHLIGEPHLQGNPNWAVATEASINYRATKLLRCGLPTIAVTKTDMAGNTTTVQEETGINPTKVFQDYREALNAAGETPLAKIEDFYRTDLVCFAELAKRERSCPRRGAGGASAAGSHRPVTRSARPDSPRRRRW